VTERVKEALDKAREQRQQSGAAVSDDSTTAGVRLGNDRILAREPFRGYSSNEQQRLLEHARVLDVGSGETFQFAGDRDAHVHFLLSGTVVLEGDNDAAAMVTAGSPAAAEPLDEAGRKTCSITATVDAEILRVPADALPRTDADDTAGVPPAEYTETFSGAQLAELVEEINTEHATLSERRPSVVDPRDLLGEQQPAAESFADVAASAESALAGIRFPDDEDIFSGDSNTDEPKIDDEIGAFARELETRFRRYVDKVKADERARYEARLQQHAERLQALAEQHISSRLVALRKRYQGAHVEKERRLRERYRALRDFANKIARQKAAIHVARRQIGEKLRLVEQIHAELSQLGSQLNNQLDDLDDLMPGATTTTPDTGDS
jgi:CRP-like cAMP-binding protein